MLIQNSITSTKLHNVGAWKGCSSSKWISDFKSTKVLSITIIEQVSDQLQEGSAACVNGYFSVTNTATNYS